jgi:hypothetical protein
MARGKDKPFLKRLLDAMEQHGIQSEPDMEVGDLQTLVRDLWALLTTRQKREIQARETYRDIIEFWEAK